MSVHPLAIYEEYASGISATLDRVQWENVHYMVEVLQEARMHRRGIFVMGNGGSASTATHLACDLDKNTANPLTSYPRFKVMALNDNMALLSALANDCGYESVFEEQLRNFLQPEDVVIAISTSGNSANVLRAVEYARTAHAFTIGWTGHKGGKLADLVDLPVVVPSDSIEHLEDIHLMLGHMVTRALREYDAVPDSTQLPHVEQPRALSAWRNNGNGNGKRNGHVNGYLALRYARGRQN